MDTIEPYDLDFVGWTERQARLLRALPPGTHGLDTVNLAEEIESLGRAEIKETSSLLKQLLVHLIKLAVQPNAPPARHWRTEALTFQSDALLSCSPGLRQRIDLPTIWRLARKLARESLAGHGFAPADLPADCPLSLDALLDSDFEVPPAVAVLASALRRSA